MLKKMVIGVTALSFLLIAGASTANSELPGTGFKKVYKDPTVNPNAPGYGLEENPLRIPLSFNKLDYSGPAATAEAKNHTPVFFCTDQDNSDYASGFTVGFDIFENGANLGVLTIGFSTKFLKPDVPHVCSLTTAWHYIRDASGDLDVEFSVWTDAGGAPGVKIASQVINITALNVRTQGPTGWNAIDWVPFNLVFVDEGFHTAIAPVPGSGSNPGVDFFNLLLDDFGTHTTPIVGGINIPAFGGWFNNASVFGSPFNYLSSIETCCEEIPFTNCGLESYYDSFASAFSIPNNFNCRQGAAMRFRTGGVDTLKAAHFWIDDIFAGPPEPGSEITLELLGDDGAGVPNAADVKASAVVGGVGFEADLYPASGFITLDLVAAFPPDGLILPTGTNYHAAMRWTGPVPHTVGTGLRVDNPGGEGDPTARGSYFFPGTYGTVDPACDPANLVPPRDGWANGFEFSGATFDWWIEIDKCSDEFIACEVATNYTSFFFLTCWCDFEGLTAIAGSFAAGGEECRIDVATAWMRDYNGLLGVYIGIYPDASGQPAATPAYEEYVPQASFPVAANPGVDPSCSFGALIGPTFSLDIFPDGPAPGPGLQIVGAYWIKVTYDWDPALNGDACQWLRGDDASGSPATLWEFGTGNYSTTASIFGSGFAGFNIAVENFRCCLPFNERVCAPGDDWPTYQHDYARTGASNNPLGAANCNLNWLWSAYSSPTGGPANAEGNGFAGPTIANGKVYVSDNRGYDCRNVTTGALIWNQNSNITLQTLFGFASGIRAHVTVEDVDTGGAVIPVAFLGTGLGRNLVAVNADNGDWLWTVGGGGFPYPGLFPTVQYSKVVVIDGIVYGTALAEAFALDAATGLPFAGWGGAVTVNLVTNNLNAVTTDGAQIFIPTYSGSVTADLYALDALTGVINWNLQTTHGLLLESGNLDPLDSLNSQDNEGFFSGASYDSDNNVVWANSYFDADFDEEGYMYRIDATSGSVLKAQKSVRSRRATPNIDQNSIYMSSYTKWANPAYDGFGIFTRNTGGLVGGLDGRLSGDRQFNDGVLSCEPGEDDWFALGTENGQLNFFRVGNANSFQFYRETQLSGFVGGQWTGGALSADALVFTNQFGLTVALAAGADRPRLHLLTTFITVPVPFSTPANTPFTWAGAFTNTGCLDLEVLSITLSDSASPPAGVSGENITSSAVSSYLQDKMNAVANVSTDANRLAKLGLMNGEKNVTLAAFDSFDFSSSLTYKAAALPDVISPGGCGDIGGVISPSPGDFVGVGDVIDIALCINGPLVTRGAHDFYATICTDDPDYFLNDSTGLECPEITLRAVGGCLQDSVVLTFGIGGANSIACFNNGFDQAFSSATSANSYDVDGYTVGSSFGELFNGWRWWAISQHRVAMTGFPLVSGISWENVAADPNFCSNTCKPAHLTNQLLTEMSFDNGATYTPVFGEIAAASWIDSARDFAPPNGTGTWNWSSSPVDYLPDSTIGLTTKETFYGAHDVLELASFRLMRAELAVRLPLVRDTIFGVRAGSMHDNDNGTGGFGDEKMVGDVASSVAHWYQPGAAAAAQVAHGYIKVPFGCGADGGPIRARANDGPQFLYSPAQMDSLFPHASLPQYAGITAQAGMGLTEAGGTDFEGLWTFGTYDVPPFETRELAVADFVFTAQSGLVDASIANQFNGLADLVNKYAGYGRGDVNNDMSTDLGDIIYLAAHVNGGGPGPYPFKYTGDLNDDGNVDQMDVTYLLDYYLCLRPCAPGAFELPNCSTGP